MADYIVIDTDPGIDDSLALVFTHAAALPVLSVTTVYGNADVDNVTRNAGYILKQLRANWELHKGAAQPLVGEPQLAESHGSHGLGDIQPTDGEIIQCSKTSAQDALINVLASGHNTTLFCLGPLTNIALICKNRPELVRTISQLIIMGGVFTERGNITDYAEFNAYNDPESFQIVMDTTLALGVKTIVIPVEVCRKVLLTHAAAEQMQKRGMLPNINAIVKPFIDYYMHDKTHGGYDGAVLYDILVPVYYQHPEFFTSLPATIKVELTNNAQRGQTTFIENAESSIQLCIDINAGMVTDLIMQTLA